MSGFLLDTNVLSEPSRPRPNRGVMEWLSTAKESDLYVTVLTFGEIQSGIIRVSEPLKRARLERFLRDLQARFYGRVLPIDNELAIRWGSMTGTLALAGLRPAAIDSIVAATALHHDLTIVTRNDVHFRTMPVAVLNPFTET